MPSLGCATTQRITRIATESVVVRGPTWSRRRWPEAFGHATSDPPATEHTPATPWPVQVPHCQVSMGSCDFTGHSRRRIGQSTPVGISHFICTWVEYEEEEEANIKGDGKEIGIHLRVLKKIVLGSGFSSA